MHDMGSKITKRKMTINANHSLILPAIYCAHHLVNVSTEDKGVS